MLGNTPAAIQIAVTDIGRSKQFYVERLGLKLEHETEGHLMLDGGGTKIMLYARPNPPTADHTLVAWFVDDVEGLVDGLTKAGVSFEQYDNEHIKTDARGIATSPDGNKAAWFKDPDGSVLGMFQQGA